jgi:hypothetical protein
MQELVDNVIMPRNKNEMLCKHDLLLLLTLQNSTA